VVAAACAGESSPAAADGAPDAGVAFDDAGLATGAEQVVAYKMKATLDPVAHTVHGEGTISFTNKTAYTVNDLWLHLYLNAFKNQKSVFVREPVGGFRGSINPRDWGSIDLRKLRLTGADEADLLEKTEIKHGADEDETDAHVPLPKPLQPGETIQLEMVWDDKLPSVVERTGYEGSFHFVGQWFPKLARLDPDGRWAHFPFHHLAEFYSDFGSYDVTIDVPAAYTIGATGPATESKVENGRRVERHVQENIHDFAWTAFDKWQRLEEKIDGVDVTVLYPPGYGDAARRELATVRFAIPYYGKRYGKYPYPVLTVVHPPERAREAGGMEYPTLITTGGPWYGPPGVLAIELVTIHELGHQWFYGMLASNEEKWPFLDEGLNSFAEQEALGRWRGPGSLVDFLGLTVSDATGQAVSSFRAAHNEPVAQPAYAFETGNDYGRLVYGRTCTILETLRRVYGDDAMGKAMGTYTRRFRFKHPTPTDFLGVMGEVLGPHAESMLRVALFEKGWVDYAVASVTSRKAREPAGIFDRDGKRETVTEGKERGGYEGDVLVQRRGTLSFPVDIELTLSDGSTRRVRWDGEGESVRVPYAGPLALRGAVVDPDHTVLLDERPSNNQGLAPEATARATRTLERITYFSQVLLQAVAP
jgi:hypothetical protein